MYGSKIKIIDFGICQIEDHETITLTDEGIGTPNYMAPECEAGAEGDISSSADLYSAGKILWSAITDLNAFARESPAFNAKSMNSIFLDQPETWHLHHIFERTIRRKPSDRWRTADEALENGRKVLSLIVSGYLPLEVIGDTCPICGFGKLQSFEVSHEVFGYPQTTGIFASQCSYCGFCFAVNSEKILDTLKQRKLLE